MSAICHVKLFSNGSDTSFCGRTLKVKDRLSNLPKFPAPGIVLFMVAMFSQHCGQYIDCFAFSSTASTDGID
ncbi:hypothetical protein RvY_06340 [Ramazzottius varieornatus]|uniref:Uncharacterized protein n=1 Tax=Ramazzottius varieornatus TaxID=947166 RepID=A0A1D1V7W5_RAMVA|nr:hypothetical protein RvY_06340 [Ramazzottius varieornatus]